MKAAIDTRLVAGTYRDRLVRSEGRWRIAHRTQHYTWRDFNPDVTRRRTPGAQPTPT